jgi:hypothetical protein
MTRRDLLGTLSVAATGRALTAQARPDRPNILFIYTDDHSHRTLSCYPEAYPWVRTPNIDRLAAQGVRCYHRGVVYRHAHAIDGITAAAESCGWKAVSGL